MYQGFIPAAFTPFHQDYSLHLDAVPQLAELYKRQNCKGVFINGTTGEFASLTQNERKLIAETWIDNSSDLSIWVHVGHTSQHEAIDLARHAVQIGARAISALPPFYFAPTSISTLIEFLRPIANAAKELPFYYYHIPSLTRVPLNMEHFIKEAIVNIPSFAGVKFSSPDLYALQKARIAASDTPIDILFGVDEMLLGALPLGIDGAIGSTYNFATPLYERLLSKYNEHEMIQSQAFQALSARLVSEFHTYGGITTGKAIMDMLGVSCGPPRPPLPSLSLRDRTKLYQALSDLDIFPSPLQAPY